MRLPKGYGSVYRLSGKRRKPYVVRIHLGWEESGKQIRGVLGYYRTRQEGLNALAEYHSNPYDLEANQVTFEKLYKVWYKDFFKETDTESKRKNYEKPYKHCTRLFKLRIAEIRRPLLQEICNEYEKTHTTANRLKTLWKRMFDFAIECEWLKSNPAAHLRVATGETEEKRIFTPEEITKIRNSISEHPHAAFIMIMLYTGCRIGELLNLEKRDLHLEERWFFVRDAKTKSGIRAVPIHDGTVPYWEYFLASSKCSFVFTNARDGQYLEYSNFRRTYWTQILYDLQIKHNPHETRHTCITMLTEAEVNKTIIKKLVGHKASQDLTERVYTHPQIKTLREAINKLQIY